MVRAFLIIIYFTARNSSYYSFMVDTSKAKCEKKCGSSNFCKINFVYLLLGSADRVQTKLNLQSLSYVCLCWGLTSQSTIFQSCRDGATASWVINQYYRGVKCLAQGHNMAAVGLEPPTSRSGVRHYYWATALPFCHMCHHSLIKFNLFQYIRSGLNPFCNSRDTVQTSFFVCKIIILCFL